jgi:hypothetical protein
MTHGQAPLGWLDIVAVVVTFGAIAIETIADLQLHAFIKTRKRIVRQLESLGTLRRTRSSSSVAGIRFRPPQRMHTRDVDREHPPLSLGSSGRPAIVAVAGEAVEPSALSRADGSISLLDADKVQ